MRDYDLYVHPNGKAYITKDARYYERVQISHNFSTNYGFFSAMERQMSFRFYSATYVLEEEKNLVYVPFEMFLAGDKE